jgi:cell division septation protein DedD
MLLAAGKTPMDDRKHEVALLSFRSCHVSKEKLLGFAGLLRFIYIFCAIAGLAACGSAPQPFRRGTQIQYDPLIHLRSADGIIVLPVQGIPRGGRLEFMNVLVAALNDAGIPAITAKIGNGISYTLAGRIVELETHAADIRLAASWGLRAGDSTLSEVYQYQVTVDGKLWRSAAAAAFEPMAAGIVARISGFLQEEVKLAKPAVATPAVATPAVAPQAGTPESGGKRFQPAVLVKPVRGAPGDGNESLTRAVKAALRSSRVLTTDDPGQARLVLAGSVKVDSSAAGPRKIAIVWTVSTPDGTEMGKASQENRVPDDAAAGKWNRLSIMAVAAAIDGIERILRSAAAKLPQGVTPPPEIETPSSALLSGNKALVAKAPPEIETPSPALLSGNKALVAKAPPEIETPSPALLSGNKALVAKAPPPEPEKPFREPKSEDEKSYKVQLAAARSPGQANSEWTRLRGKHPDLLGKLEHAVVKTDLGPGKGVFYRLYTGPLGGKAAARALCAKLAQRKVDCFVVRPRG